MSLKPLSEKKKEINDLSNCLKDIVDELENKLNMSKTESDILKRNLDNKEEEIK